MLTATVIEDILKLFTYKPGTTFSVRERFSFTGDIEVIISIKVLDSYPPHARTELNGLELFHKHELEKMQIAEFKKRIYDRLVTMETHEVQEFLKYKGAHVVDPHPEQATYRKAAAEYNEMMNRHLEQSMKPLKEMYLQPARNAGKQMAMADALAAIEEQKYKRKKYGMASLYGMLDGVVVITRFTADGDVIIEEMIEDLKGVEPKLEAAKYIPEQRRKGYSAKPYEAVRPRRPRPR